MILKTRISLLSRSDYRFAIITEGSLGGMKSDLMIQSNTKGFGGTLGNIGIVIGFGVMIGALLQLSGASRKWLRPLSGCWVKREELTCLIGIVSMAVFCDSAFVVLTPLTEVAFTYQWKVNCRQGAALAAGLVINTV